MAHKATKPVKHKELTLPGNKLFSWNFRSQALILALLGFLFYANTFSNEYALDDGIVIEKNDYVQKGFGGIRKIMKTDAYESFYRQMNAKQQLSGGRYRPLSIVTFAIEQQLFGKKDANPKAAPLATLRHVVNVLLYILSVLALLYLLHYFIFPEDPLIAFLCSLIFLIHPLHTEVVANVKSRDEIMSFLFICFTLSGLLRYRENGKKRFLALSLLSYFCALLSKEYAITLLALIPMLLYILKNYTVKEAATAVLPFAAVAVVYLLMRFSAVGFGSTQENPDVLNNPYKYARGSEELATKIEILDHYLRLFFFPHPLSSDYSYNTISYKSFGDWRVWLSVLIHAAMSVGMVLLVFRRNIIGWALAFYLFHLLLISNLVMDIGATMGERLVYHSSLGLAIIMAVLVVKALRPLADKKIYGVIAVSVLLTACCASIVIPRNSQWKNDSTLFISDAEVVPNSALVNGNAGKAYIDLSEKPENKAQEHELLMKSIPFLKRSVEIHKEYVNGYLNLGVTYFKLQDYQKAEECWKKAESIYPNNPYLKINFGLLGQVYYNEAMKAGAAKPQEAIRLLEKATSVDPSNAELWYNLGGASYTIGDYEKARKAWQKTLDLKPGHPEASKGMQALPPPPPLN